MRPHGARRLAAIFVAPSFPKNYEEKCESLVGSWIVALRGLSGTAKAWTFPDEAGRMFSKESRRYYPGAALVIKEIH